MKKSLQNLFIGAGLLATTISLAQPTGIYFAQISLNGVLTSTKKFIISK